MHTTSFAILAATLALAPAAHAQSAEWNALTAEATTLYRQGKYEAAAEPAKKALDLAIRESGPDHTTVATSLNNLGVLYRTQGKYDLALPNYQRALAIHEKAGPGSLEVATALDNLAMLHDVQAQFDRAEPLYRRALAIREKVSGPQSLEAARSLNNLGEMYSEKRDFDRAEPMLKRAYDIRVAALGREHADVRRSMDNLSAAYTAQGKFALAEEYATGVGANAEAVKRKLLMPPSSPGRTPPK